MAKFFLLIFSFALISFSCKPTVFLYSIKSKTTKSNITPQDSFEFNFALTGQGVWFKITNNTDDNAFIIWDESYLVEPTGNSQKLFNPDILEENILDQNVAQKTSNTTIIPAHKSTSRFTSSISSLGKELYTFNYQWASSNNYFATTTTHKKSTTSNYWPSRLVIEDGSYQKDMTSSLQNSTSYILKYPTLSIGFAIKHKNTQKNFTFDFLVDTVKIFQLNKSETNAYYIGECTNTSNGSVCEMLSKEKKVLYLTLHSGENIICLNDTSSDTKMRIIDLKNGEKRTYFKDEIKESHYYSGISGTYDLGLLLRE